jgi:hypothetical protein
MSAVETTTQYDHAKDLRELKDLIESSRVEEARKLAPILAKRWPESAVMQHFAKVLEPAKVIPIPPGSPRPPARSFAEDRAWVRENGWRYPGCWIVTIGSRFILADPSWQSAQKRVRELVDLEKELPFGTYQVPEPAGDAE